MLHYDPLTSIFTRNGKRAGSALNTGYREIQYKNQRWLEHRLAWYLTYGNLPIKHIDHINGIKDDNRIENLRDVSSSVNLRNQRKIRGYHKCNGRWRAQYSLGNKVYHIGMYDTEEAARQAYEETVNAL